MTIIAKNSGKPELAEHGAARTGPADDLEHLSSGIHHCLKYLAIDARGHGMAQTAGLLDMVARLALDEAKALRSRH